MALPSYIDALEKGILRKRTQQALKSLASCELCPRRCRVNRLNNESGFCQTGRHSIVCSYFAHHGEEPPVSGNQGSGAIFFSKCNLRCVYCQNHEFSQGKEGRQVQVTELAGIMLELQDSGCHNINLITPSHNIPQILEALLLAAEKGLCLPILFNTSGYDLVETLRLLEGIIDIYLADMRYASEEISALYSQAPDYPGVNQAAIKEMHHQVGDAVFNSLGLISSGLIIRHLVLPNNLSGTEEIFRFIADKISPETHVSLMSQYFPTHRANLYPALKRRIYKQEYTQAIALFENSGLHNGWIQESRGLKRFAGTHIKRNI